MQLAGFPAEVIDSVVSVVCRMAFDFGLWSDGVSPLLFVCEEAHRYASADRKIGFGPTRRAVSRIAKEAANTASILGSSRNGRPSSTPPSYPSATPSLRCASPTSATSHCCARRSPTPRPICCRSSLARHPRGTGFRRRRRAANPAAFQGSTGASIAAQRSHDCDGAVGHRRPRRPFHQRRTGALAWRHVEPRRCQRSRFQRPAATPCRSADAAALDGTRSRPVFALEKSRCADRQQPVVIYLTQAVSVHGRKQDMVEVNRMMRHQSLFGSDKIRTGLLAFCFDAFSSREP